MTVKEIFDLRKQGRIEEAYEAIRARYATYRGKYTTLCMFWTARDIFNLRMADGRTEEARKIYEALQRVLSNIDDHDGRAVAFMQYAHRRLASVSTCSTGAIKVPTAAAPAGSSSTPATAGVIALTDSVGEGLNPGQQKVLDCIKATPGLKVPGISDETGSPAKSIERHISALIARNLIEHRGSKKTGGYHAL